ncbi:MAG TPA: hypothetical protein VE093_45585, partial [Polyangiaceae bacterium]|nr:hypothetical protein [Polyangiaceae bacterium]
DWRSGGRGRDRESAVGDRVEAIGDRVGAVGTARERSAIPWGSSRTPWDRSAILRKRSTIPWYRTAIPTKSAIWKGEVCCLLAVAQSSTGGRAPS